MNSVLGSAVLDVAIGMAFLYLLLSIICTTVNEWISGILKTRSKMLEQAIKQLLDDQPGVMPPSPASDESGGAPPAAPPPQIRDFLEQFYHHPIIDGMMRGLGADGKHFSYLPARSFSTVVMDLVTAHAPGRIDVETLEHGIKIMPDGEVKRALLAAIQNAGDSLEEAQKNIEAWFDDTMDRVSGWYKRVTQKWTIILALLVTVGVNADTIHMMRTLWMNPTLRAQVVEQAKERAAKPRPTATIDYTDPNDPKKPVVRSESNQLSTAEQKVLENLIGWTKDRVPVGGWAWIEHLLGWILTAIAVSLGAPFWFDTLNKFMNLRNAGKSPDEAAKKPEKRQQPPADRRE